MPNYTKQEKDLLSDAEIALSEASRQPRLAKLTEAELFRLIGDLQNLLQGAGPFGEDGQKTRADLLKTALNRANNERRKRGLKPEGTPAPQPSVPASTAKRVPATTPRKPAGRKSAEARKDLRTGSRRVAKAAKPDAAASVTTSTEPPAAAMPAPAPLLAVKAAAPVQAAAPAQDGDKEAAKQARKAEKKAAKEAEKAARKAEKKAAQQAERTARKAEKEAAKAEKAARKAEKDALKSAKAAARQQGDSGKKKSGKAKGKEKQRVED